MLQRANAIKRLRTCSNGAIGRVVCTNAFSSRYPYSTSSSPEHEIAVLGGGLTGLSTAHWLTKTSPKSHITIYESQSKLGGWLQSSTVDVGSGTVVFEHGPRTLRVGSLEGVVTLAMIKDLGLTDQVLYTSKSSPAAHNRFIYYPDHLVRLPFPPKSIWELFRASLMEPLFRGVALDMLKEPWQIPRENSVADESVGSFLTRRLGSTVADNLASAMLHGIYAGDVWQLSAKSLFPGPWTMEKTFGSLAQGIRTSMEKGPLARARDMDLVEGLRKEYGDNLFPGEYASSSVYTFRKGVSQLVGTLEEALRSNPNVSFALDCSVTDIQDDKAANKIKITTDTQGSTETATKDLVISTLHAGRTASICSSAKGAAPAQPLKDVHAVTVMVVNFYFAEEDLLPVEGFGYLIPRSVPFEQNPERALGVIFDSDAVQGQDTVKGTKLTVMMGGHYWDGWEEYPTVDEAKEMAFDLLNRHLGPLPKPKAEMASLATNCIPQYTVGHSDRMKAAHWDLARNFGGRLRVAGNSYTGVGVHNCTRAAYDVAADVDEWFKGKAAPKTGLESFAEEPIWEHVLPKTGKMRLK